MSGGARLMSSRPRFTRGKVDLIRGGVRYTWARDDLVSAGFVLPSAPTNLTRARGEMLWDPMGLIPGELDLYCATIELMRGLSDLMRTGAGLMRGETELIRGGIDLTRSQIGLTCGRATHDCSRACFRRSYEKMTGT